MTAATPAVADVHALLVGVGDYRHLNADLRGPVNDVRLMAETLGARGADSITVLTDAGAILPAGVVHRGQPTRAAILSELGDLPATVKDGDTVFFYFSGHGSQAPDRNGDEAGGYDEILLPTDAKGWRGAIGDVENAIVDDEFQPLFQAILDTGATLVAVLDTCHSATGFRAVERGAGVARYVDPAALGVPEDVETGGGEGALAPPLTGDFAFLYSSQSDQRSFEYPLGARANPSNWYGAFTVALADVLRTGTSATWAQTLRGAADTMQRGDVLQTPDGEGTALDLPVFGVPGPALSRIGFSGDTVQGGLLSGLSEGAEVEVFASATAETPIATATLADVGATTASLRHAEPLPETGYVVVTAPGLPEPFRIAPPVIMDGRDYAPVLDQLGALAAAGLPEGVAWNAAVPDAVPVLKDGALILTGPDGILDPVGAGSSPRMGDDAAVFFEAAARTHRLRRALALAEGAAKGGFSFGGPAVKVSLEREAGALRDGACVGGAQAMPFRPDQPVHDCDRLWLTMTNTSRTAQDVTVLYVDRDFGITALWPEPGLSNRIAFNESQEAGLEIRLPDGRPGLEEIIVIAVPATPSGPRMVLSGLADPVATRAAPGGSALHRFLWAASDPTTQGRSFGAAGGMVAPTLTRLRLTLTTLIPQ